MTWTRRRTLGLTLCLLGGAAMAQAPHRTVITPAPYRIQDVQETAPASPPSATALPPAYSPIPDGTTNGVTPDGPIRGLTPSTEPSASAPVFGPTPVTKVGILQELLFGDNKDAPVKIAGWLDADYTYRSTGPGRNNNAPVMNRFGNEFLMREIGLWLYKPLDPKEWSWGFNALFLGGSDASLISPVAGGWRNTDPRFGSQFTDLNLTFHLPLLTEGGIDVKAGRQTTVLGPMSALSIGRWFSSSDYAWYNLEEGRYTGVSANWHISKRLDWYNGIEIGGWGVFFNNTIDRYNYITQINYWLDEEAKRTKVWTTVLTGPTGRFGPGNTTIFELGIQHNWTDKFYQILDTQMCYSKQPIFFQAPPGYRQRSYDVYTYVGYHLTPEVDLLGRAEWFKDVDGGGYPGGTGNPHTNYYETTVGVNYHPNKWLEFRPEIRYDYASNNAFGAKYDRKNQLSINADVLLKF